MGGWNRNGETQFDAQYIAAFFCRSRPGSWPSLMESREDQIGRTAPRK